MSEGSLRFEKSTRLIRKHEEQSKSKTPLGSSAGFGMESCDFIRVPGLGLQIQAFGQIKPTGKQAGMLGWHFGGGGLVRVHIFFGSRMAGLEDPLSRCYISTGCPPTRSF